jgi:alpha-L-fucosidase
MEWHGGRLEAVYNLKDIKESPLGKCGEYQEGVGVLDLERGIANESRLEPWQTDTCIGDWYYKRGITYKSAETVIHMLADIVSKNGNLLLNFPLRPDGTLDSEAEAVLEDLGKWMAVNAEAIHGTRPWKEYGEGPKHLAGGQFNEKNLRYSAEDIRFTTRGTTLYAILLGWPEGRNVRVASLASGKDQLGQAVRQVQLLGSGAPLKWAQGTEGLQVELPTEKPGKHAYVLKI